MKFDEGFTDLVPICNECGHEMKPELACTASGKTLRLYCSECDHEDAIVANRCFRCGSDNISIDDDDGFVLCVDCGMWSGDGMPLFYALDWWNHSGDYAAGLEARIAELEASLFTANVNLAGLRGAYDQQLAERSEWEPLRGEGVIVGADIWHEGHDYFETGRDCVYLPDGYAVCRRAGSEEAT